ncbi:MAG: 4Fe-4S binding protein, partial [Acutalibacteraceae bacterium]
MKIAILSGKGGTGKTFASVNLACVAQKAVYLDCDVEEPNGHLFFNPQNITKQKTTVLLPEINNDKCDGCRKCVDFCKFNALA